MKQRGCGQNPVPEGTTREGREKISVRKLDRVPGFDVSFIKNQFSQYPYVMRSYFDGTSPENNYEVSNVIITFKENQYSRTEENYVQLLAHSSGADSDRMFRLRKKPSTGEWFIFSDTYRALLAGIRIPKSVDKWA